MTARDHTWRRWWLDTGRAGNLPSVWSNTLAALALASSAWPDAVTWLVATALASCAYVAGATLNDVVDVDFDRRHRPERPIPAGRVSRPAAATLALGGLAVSGLGFVLAGAATTWLIVMLGAIVSYNWLHKRWTGAVGLMAACRGGLGLTVASMSTTALPAAVWWWVAALWIYIVLLSLLARAEYRVARREVIVREWVGRLLALMPLVDSAALASVGLWPAAAVCALAVPLGRAAQRVFAAT